MSAYKGHRGPNVSQYIANLNQLSPPQGPLDEPVESGEDFSAFLNNEFFDINNNPIPGFDAPIDLEVGVTAEQSTQPGFGDNSRKHSIQTSADPSMEFNLNGKCISSLYFSSRRYAWQLVVWPRWSHTVCNPSANGRMSQAHANPAMRPTCSYHPHTRILATQMARTRRSPAAERTMPAKHAIARAARYNTTDSIVPRAFHLVTTFRRHG